MKERLYIKGSHGEKEEMVLSKYAKLSPGGEADVYIDNWRVLKVFKESDHPDLDGYPDEQKAAQEKIELMQTKLPEFPKNLPKRVISPEALARDEKDIILGYTMKYLDKSNDLRSYSEKSFRKRAGLSNEIANEIVLAIFRDLHHTVSEIHEADVVIGDLNDTNVLVKDKAAYIIDADSFQFGKYQSFVFKNDFIDPKLLDMQAKGWDIKKGARQTTDSDWYAYNVMLMQSLLFLKPYDGIYRPNPNITTGKRLEKRITIFNKDVNLPDGVIHYRTLPDDLIQHFEDVFVKDIRGEFPAYLLDMRWKKCGCGAEHARAACPYHTTSTRKKPVERGDVRATTVFKSDFGLILTSAYQKKQLRYLYHEGDEYKREDGNVLLKDKFYPEFNFEIQGRKTILKKAIYNGNVAEIVFDPQGEKKISPANDTLKVNSDVKYFMSHGKLWREDKSGNIMSSEYLKGEPAFWVGEDFGILCEKSPKGIKPEFVFDAHDLKTKRSINNSKETEGQLVDSACYFDKDLSWLITSMKEGQDITNYCTVINQKGEALMRLKTKAGNDTWLSNINGKCAVGTTLLIPTDNGIKKATFDLKNKDADFINYPETAPFVNKRTNLLRGKNEIYAVNAQDIVRLEFKEEKIVNTCFEKDTIQKDSLKERDEHWKNMSLNEAMDKWKKNTNEFLDAYKNDPDNIIQQTFLKKILKKDGQTLDEVKVNADTFYSTFYEGKEKGNVEFFARRIADTNTRDEIEQNKYLIRKLGHMYGESFGKVSLLYIQNIVDSKEKETSNEVVKKFLGVLDHRWIKNEKRKEGVLGFRKEIDTIVTNKEQVNEDFNKLFREGPDTVMKDILMYDCGLSEAEAVAKMQDQGFTEKMRGKFVEQLFNKRFQAGQLTKEEVFQIANTTWGRELLDKIIKNG